MHYRITQTLTMTASRDVTEEELAEIIAQESSNPTITELLEAGDGDVGCLTEPARDGLDMGLYVPHGYTREWLEKYDEVTDCIFTVEGIPGDAPEWR